jgi:hypothetical protein
MRWRRIKVLHAVNNVLVPEGWNNTTIVLIPKIDNPEKVTQFRLISLCNVVYKVISKMLSNQLKMYLPEADYCQYSSSL